MNLILSGLVTTKLIAILKKPKLLRIPLNEFGEGVVVGGEH